MMKMKNMVNNGGSGTEPRGMEWEMRPGGMLVQRRTDDDSDRKPVQPPTIKVRVKYGSTYHEVNISSIATFGILLQYFLIFYFILFYYYHCYYYIIF
jgi:hypothetical protein